MRKLFTLAAAMFASISLMAAVADLNFNEPTALPEGYVYSATNTPVIATIAQKSAVYVTNGGGGTVTTACFADGGLVASQGKRWMGFVTEEDSKVVLSVYSGKKTWTLYNSEAEAQATFTNTTNNTWEEWTIESLPAGAYILTTGNSQCYVSAITFTGSAPSTDPVTAAEISGTNACAIGGSVELTCTAAKATTYQWYLGGVAIEGATAKKYTFTPTAAGEFSFTCAASNEYTATPVMAKAFVVTVSDPSKACGELIKATLKGGTNADMSGVLGGTFDTNLGSGKYKLDKGKYMGVKLTAGAFRAGDTLIVTMTAAGQNYPCLFADKDRNTCLFLATEVSEALEYKFVLPAAANGLTALYLSRGDDSDAYKWNPTVATISVTRSCVASSDATIAGVYAMVGEDKMVFTQDADTFFYNIPNQVGDLTQVSVYFTLNHPAATANVKSPFTINIPAPGQKVEQNVTVTAEDGTTTKTYVIRGIRSAALSNDATLKSLSVNGGYTLTPTFAPDVYLYSITKAYGAANPGSDSIKYETNHPNAHGVHGSSAQGDTITLEVTAEDGTTKLLYSIAILEAEAQKELLEVAFSNGVHGFIKDGNISVPYLAGTAQPTFTEAKFWKADGEPTAAIVEGKLVVTGADKKTAEYTIQYDAVTPMTAKYDTITFDSTEVTRPNGYVYSVYGWDASKGVKFSKDVEEASNRRISEGKDRIYIALPAAKEVKLFSGSAAGRNVTILVNGVKDTTNTKTAKSGECITIALNNDAANFVAIESNGNNGDAGFTKMQLVQQGEEPTLYTVTITKPENGTIEFGDNKADHKYAEGEKVCLVITPNENYKLVAAKAETTSGDAKTLLPDQQGIVDFTMPAEDVTVSATFEQETPVTVGYMVDIDDDDLPMALGYSATMVQDTLVAPGTIVTMTYKGLDAGYSFDKFIVYKTDDIKTLVPLLTDNTFEMPAYPVTITASYWVEPVLYTVTITKPEHGTIEFTDLGNDDHKYAEGDNVHLSIKADAGYKLVRANAGNEALQVAEDGSCSFVMPGQDVTVSATFEEESQGIDDIDAAAPATKRLINGVLFIEKNGKLYNAQGAEIK